MPQHCTSSQTESACIAMLLLTNCEVHTGKYLDRSFEVRKTKVQIFPVLDRANWSIRALLYGRIQH